MTRIGQLKATETMRTDQFFRCLADRTRVNIILLLWSDGELSVTELSALLAQSESQVTRHMALMRKNAMVIERRHELNRYFRINSDMPKWAFKVLKHTYNGNKSNVDLLLSTESE